MALASGFVFEPLALEIKGLKNAPKVFYYVGNTHLLDTPCKIAIVGTRKPSLYTRHATAQLAKHITRIGGVAGVKTGFARTHNGDLARCV
ncbi:DNA-processing protein DprA [Helicobacter bizzozeronii]|uniref:DNA-processing protein DprA n=1 Tax=Helicobacter bizzozeronii TaxID=56877 RepID=UPI001F367708|nr:DNA-processing protein DprA [Helicobacter bizzozeronii]